MTALNGTSTTIPTYGTTVGSTTAAALQPAAAPSASSEALAQALAGIEAISQQIQQLLSVLASGALGAAAPTTSQPIFSSIAGGGAAAPATALPAAAATAPQSAAIPLSTATKVDGTQGSNVPGRAAINPPSPDDPRFVGGTTGPIMKKGKAKTIKLEDGTDLNGKKGRRQNAGDKKQNNYSVTDANYNADLGVPKTIMGKKTTYDGLISGYSAAGFVEEFYPEQYARMVQSQNAGQGTVVDMSLALTGWGTPETTAQVKSLGIDPASITKVIPGSGVDLKTYIGSGKDATGQDWARPHHALSQWHAYHQLVTDGVDPDVAHVLSGDDAVSGSGRVNGVNNQDNNKSGMNDGEQNTYAFAVKYAKDKGLDPNKVVKDMLGAHAMTNLSPGTLTDPKINKLIDQDKDVRSLTDARVAAIVQGFASNKIDGNENDKGDSKADNKTLFKTADAQAGAAAFAALQATAAPTGAMAGMSGMAM